MNWIHFVLAVIAVSLVVKVLMDFWLFGPEIRAALERDPAAKYAVVVLFFYPGLRAIRYHRLAHFLHELRVPILPVFISQWARFWTGVEIHPGAKIGRGLFIDHGMGVVIGETSEIGSNVTIYQGVTLGGTGKERGKRHPTIRDGAVLGAGSKILGNIVIGEGALIGANAVVIRPVPAYSTVVGVPGRIARRDGRRIAGRDLDHVHLPDPVSRSLERMQHAIERLERELHFRQERPGRPDQPPPSHDAAPL